MRYYCFTCKKELGDRLQAEGHLAMSYCNDHGLCQVSGLNDKEFEAAIGESLLKEFNERRTKK